MSRYRWPKYSNEEPALPVAIVTVEGGAGMKYISSSEIVPTASTAAADVLKICQRLNPSMPLP